MNKLGVRVALVSMSAVCLALSSDGAFTNTTGMQLRLVPSSIGSCPEVADASGNGHDAFSCNNVTCGQLSNGRHLTGFSSTTSYLAVTNAVSTWNADWTAVAWVRNPDLSGSSPMPVMRDCRSAGRGDVRRMDEA